MTNYVTKRFKGYQFGPGPVPHCLNIPEGLRVEEREGVFFLDEFPPDLFPPGSMILHDATYYGIRLTANDVVEHAQMIASLCFSSYKRFTKGLI